MKTKVLRKIPATMVTQHPDHANKPYWHNKPFIAVGNEAYECYSSFADLGASEYKWDWEGKLVDESVIERLLSEYTDFFSKNKLGEDFFLTFRLPNPKVETEYRLGRAFMGIIAAAGLTKFAGFSKHPLFEVILPMTETSEEMIAIQEAFQEIISLKHPILKHEFSTIKHIEIIPLFEKTDTISTSDQILHKYLKRHKELFKFKPEYLRPYVARSDPALNSGIVPTVLAIKIALSKFKEFEKSHKIKLYPIIGAGSLPFRGGLNPTSVADFAKEYSGIRTTTIQSAFRYDYSQKEVAKGIAILENLLKKGNPQHVSPNQNIKLLKIMDLFEKEYTQVIEEIAPLINRVASYIPRRRERVQHVGLFGYARGEGKVKLPRAITFTASLYSLGIPPELIGTGRGLKKAQELGYLPLIEKFYVNIKKDLTRSGRFLNKKNLSILSKTSPAWKLVEEDVVEIEKYVGKLGPKTEEEQESEKITTDILDNLTTGEGLSLLIERAAILRKSIG